MDRNYYIKFTFQKYAGKQNFEGVDCDSLRVNLGILRVLGIATHRPLTNNLKARAKLDKLEARVDSVKLIGITIS